MNENEGTRFEQKSKLIVASSQTRKMTAILAMICFILVGIFLLQPTISTKAQDNPPPTPTPNPTFVSLENLIATQQIQLDTLNKKIEDETRDRIYFDRDIGWKWGISATVATIIISLLAFLGVKSLKDLQHLWGKQSQTILNKAIYKLDLENMPVYLPMDQNLENIHSYLQRRKFGKLGFYKKLEDVKKGVIIISIQGMDEQNQNLVYQKLIRYVKESKPDSTEIGIIIYSPGGLKIPNNIMECYENLVSANFLTTIASNIFVVARGIDLTLPES